METENSQPPLSPSKSSKTEECITLKNIKYKTMLMNGKQIQETKSEDNLNSLDKFLENEKKVNVNEPWCKLNKAEKIKKLNVFAQSYKEDNNLSEEEFVLLINFLKETVDRKKLNKAKDVIWDKTTGNIKDIPCLVYIKTTRHFTLKNIDKRVSTLKSLPPKKNHIHTIKNKNNKIQNKSNLENFSENESPIHE
jgi:hypothetical protein